ncbi:MAG: hypothetical protein NTY27_05665 [Actinobacteria bacterium]|nr:hypothetical protein [Actinomycetota bacterium]
MNLETITSGLRSRPKISFAGLLITFFVLFALLTGGNSTPAWWVKAPVAAAAIDTARTLITLENDRNDRSSLLVFRDNLGKDITKLQVLPSYFDTMAVSGSRVLLAKRGITRAQCINATTEAIQEPLALPSGLRITGASSASADEFLIWGRGPEDQTMVFNTNCTRLTLLATVEASLKFICPVEKQLVAIDIFGTVLRANQFFEFEVTDQKFRHVDLLACGDSGIIGHLKNSSGDFLITVGPKSAVTQPLVNGKGVFLLLFEQNDSEWFGLKHGKNTTTVSLFPIAR